jgi:hypothetical protein
MEESAKWLTSTVAPGHAITCVPVWGLLVLDFGFIYGNKRDSHSSLASGALKRKARAPRGGSPTAIRPRLFPDMTPQSGAAA